METKNTQFRKALSDEFVKRTKKNSRFSLRAFAQQMEIEASTLAQILNGKRKLTPKMCMRLGSKLGFSPLKIEVLMKSAEEKEKAFGSYHLIEEDAFKVISDWQYYAILELTHCHGFKGKPLWISKVLGLSFAETIDAIDRLKRLNYLEITEDGKWIDRLGDSQNLGNEFKAPAFTEHQRQILNKAIEALDKTAYEKRIQTSMTITCSNDKVAEAKGMVLNFIEELDVFLKSGEKRDDVYTISFSLFPLSKIEGVSRE